MCESRPVEAVQPIVRGTPLRVFDPSASAVVDSAAHPIAALTARAAGATAGVVYLADGDRLRMVGQSGLRDGWQAFTGVAPGRTTGGLVLACRRPVVIDDARTDERVPADATIHEHGGRAYAGFPIHDEDGEIVGVCAAMDYEPHPWSAGSLAAVETAARLCAMFLGELDAHAEADRRRRFLDAMLERLRVGVAGCGPDGQVVFANPALGRLGLRAPGRQGDPAAVPLARALAGEVVRDAEIILPGQGAPDRVLLADAEPLRGAGGEQLGAVLSVWDATNRRRAERFLDAERAVGEALVEAHSIDEAGATMLRAVCDALGWRAAQLWLIDDECDALRLVAGHPGDAVAGHQGDAVAGHPGDAASAQLRRGEGLAGAAWERNEPVWNRDPGGVAIPIPNGGATLGVLTFTAEALADAEDTVAVLLSGIAGQVAQFLHRRRAEDAELALARSKDEYLFLVGHELRTPLTSIASYTELLGEAPGLSADDIRLLEVIGRNTDRLRQIIEELLDLAALDSGHAELVWEWIDLGVLADAALTDMRLVAEEGGVTLRADVAPGLTVQGDGERLRQVLDHLLRNAVTHSPGGTVTLSVAPFRADSVEVTVADTGSGIPEDEGERVFSPFYRTVLSRDQGLPGAGLGLALSRGIIQAHHGTIRLTPNRPQGTRVVLRLPRTELTP